MITKNTKHLIWPVILTLALTGCGKKEAKTDTANTETQTEAITNEEAPAVVTSLSDEAKKAAEQYLVKGTPTVFFFHAEWCPACRAFKPTLEEVEGKFAGVKVLKMNVDEQKDLTKTFKVSSIPSLFFFDKDGKFVESTTGGLAVDKLTQEFEKVGKGTAEAAAADQKTAETTTTETTTTTEVKKAEAPSKETAKKQ